MATEKRLIDPDELRHMIEILYQEHYVKSYDKTVHDIFNAVRRRINRCSTVDTAPVVHGRWLTPEEYANQGYNGWLYCSVCEQPMREFYGWDYCPNCGAMMDGDGNG